ncbi:3-deoxy-7-phosphoheptulonate synthase-like protein [Bordetella hinzii CA90 BAL1384]|nr:3-deoxy-7-phosphoheptulonate synthase-like protein [Bordetella hinzii CA90 BAL1384]
MPSRMTCSSSCASTSRSRAPLSAGRASSMTRAWTAASASMKACGAPARCCWKSPAWACPSRPSSWNTDLLSPQFIADLIAWGAIGARTTESPSHRQLASGLSCPLGFKNGTDGGVQIAADAMVAASASHAFMGMTKMGVAAIFETRGNTDTHVILRGGKNGPNYDTASVQACCEVLRKAGLREQVMIDCSHANSNKSHERQVDVARDIAQRVAGGETRITGLMIESNLQPGRQDLKPGVPLAHGVSITDACLGWTQTEPVLADLARAVRERRARR